MNSDFHLAVDPAQVEASLAAYLQHPGETSADAIRAARQHRALPLWEDWTGCILLRPTGDLSFVAWDRPERTEEMGASQPDREMAHAARAIGSRRFPAVAGLAPQRTASARECPSCHGTGRVDAAPPNIVCQCGGLGWLP
jgi:hypothetical protein